MLMMNMFIMLFNKSVATPHRSPFLVLSSSLTPGLIRRFTVAACKKALNDIEKVQGRWSERRRCTKVRREVENRGTRRG